MDEKSDEKVAVITGAARGIGMAAARQFLQAGYFTGLCSKNPENVISLQTELSSSFAGKFTVSGVDVSVEDEVRKFVSLVAHKEGRIDVLVNNAGVVHVSPIEETDSEKWDEMMSINAKGVFLMVKHCLPFMSRGSRIINIGSNASKNGFPRWSAYCASKFAMLGFTKALREEVRDRGISVSAVLPGPTSTDVWNSLPGKWDSSKMMSPEAIAKTVVFVANQPTGANVDEIDIVPSAGSL